jgi:hypothetical protein
VKTWTEIRKPGTPEREAEISRWIAAEVERINQQSREVGASAEAEEETEK